MKKVSLLLMALSLTATVWAVREVPIVPLPTGHVPPLHQGMPGKWSVSGDLLPGLNYEVSCEVINTDGTKGEEAPIVTVEKGTISHQHQVRLEGPGKYPYRYRTDVPVGSGDTLFSDTFYNYDDKTAVLVQNCYATPLKSDNPSR